MRCLSTWPTDTTMSVHAAHLCAVELALGVDVRRLIRIAKLGKTALHLRVWAKLEDVSPGSLGSLVSSS